LLDTETPFHRSANCPHLTFKGGTSLSKAYGLIDRFSEDIDLTISREAPSLADGKNPTEGGISGKERKRRIDTLKQNVQRYIEEIVLNSFVASVKTALRRNDDWQIVIDPDDPDKQTILFEYPALRKRLQSNGRDVYGLVPKF
jgi:hypothetical protein